MNVLGISCYYHDSAATLVQDGRVTAAAQEERFTRKKHDSSFPENAVGYCLAQAGLSVSGLDHVVFYEKPLLKFERLLETYLAYAPMGFRSFVKAMPLWLKEKLWMSESLSRKLDGFEGDLWFPEHHESHAASAFFPSPFKDAAFITLDGVGEWSTASFGAGRGNTVEILRNIDFPHSLGLLYSAFTYYTGFKVNSGEYKLMGLAPYGEPKYADRILDNLIDLKEDGSFRLDMGYFDYCAGLKMTSSKFDELFGGPPRKPETGLTQRHMDLAASVQAVTEEAVLRMARHVRSVTGMDRLCLAGGVALNCVANGKLLRSGIFEDIWVQPASGDAGGALGAALFCHYNILGNERDHRMYSGPADPYLGPSFTEEEAEAYLRGAGAKFERLSGDDLIDRVARLISGDNVVGWFDGRMEYGPRALGARSILANAMSPRMQEAVNLKIKFRESFRPFAPAVTAEDASEWFDLDRESPYMLIVAQVREDRLRGPEPGTGEARGLEKLKAVRSEIPAVTHVDNSARVQTVNRQSNPRFHALIKRFGELTGCPVVINTSFNVRGEPIVCTPEDAYRCFMRTDMDYLAIGNILLAKADQPRFEDDRKWMDEFELD